MSIPQITLNGFSTCIVLITSLLLRWILIPTPPMGLSLKDAGSFDEENPIIQLDAALNGKSLLHNCELMSSENPDRFSAAAKMKKLNFHFSWSYASASLYVNANKM